MKFIDFFSGVGGFTRGLELAGHKCIGHCEFDKFAEASYRSMHTITEEQRARLGELDKKKRQKEILKDEYLNGEWYEQDIRTVRAVNMPVADCWTFGAPCQEFSIAGRRAGLEGERSSLVREIFRILEETKETNKPEWLIYENVKGMLSTGRGLDFLSILAEMDRLGYDAEWQIINSRWYVPQNRERVYVIGHNRRRRRSTIFPITGNDGENNIKLIGGIYDKNGRLKNQYRTYADGCAPCLNTAGGGGREPHLCFTVDKSKNNPAILNQAVSLDLAAWSEKYNCYLAVRKLTPKEFFRLQGWTNDYFEKTEFMNSNCQLYKQAGNGATVNVVKEIGERL